MNRTKPRERWRTALLVAVDDKLAKACTVICSALDLKTAQSPGPQDASERIVALQPAIVVVSVKWKPAWAATIDERALAAGAEVVWLADDVGRTELLEALSSAASASANRAARSDGDL